jgi:hypothetical protein
MGTPIENADVTDVASLGSERERPVGMILLLTWQPNGYNTDMDTAWQGAMKK